MVKDRELRDRWYIDQDYKQGCITVLAEHLSSLRAKADITQAELSTLIGVSRQTYQSIEAGKRMMSWNTFLSLLFFFDKNQSTHHMLRDVNAYPYKLETIIRGIE